jgi:type IV pilus assembly protein PilC
MLMPTYQYVAKDSKGAEKRGLIDGKNEQEVQGKLKSMGLSPTAVNQTGGPAGEKKKAIRLGTGKLKPAELAMFTRQLCTLLQSGLPLLRALKTLGRQAKKFPRVARVLTELAEAVEGGTTFSEALGGQPKTFSKLYVSMVRAGEASGALETVLERLAEFLEKSERIKGKVKSAMMYPAAVMTVAIGITMLLMIKVVPQFETIFNDMIGPGNLPGITQFVLGISRFLQHNWWVVIIAIGLLVFAFNFFRKTKQGSYAIDIFLMRAPPLNNLVVRVIVARFCRTLGTLMNSGVAVLQALQIVKDTVGNEVVARCIDKVHDAVKEGEGISKPLGAQNVFPDMTVSMIEVGEETGSLPDMLNRVADIYEEEVDRAVDGLTALLEPIMIVGLAIIVGTIVIALFAPMVTLIEKMSG